MDKKVFSGSLDGKTQKKGTKGIFWQMKVSNKTFNVFDEKTIAKLNEVQLGDDVSVAYYEKENPNGTFPFKNVLDISVPEKLEVNEEQIDLSEGSCTGGMKVYNNFNPAFFGMVHNNTINMIICDATLSKRGAVAELRERYEEVFELIWQLAEDKKKEKSGEKGLV